MKLYREGVHMKKQIFLGAVCLGLAFAGCSSSDDKKPAESDQQEETVQTGQFASFTSALESKGFTIEDLNDKGDTITFTASNDNGSLKGAAYKYASDEEAVSAYKDQVSQLGNDSYEEVNTFNQDGADLTILLNDFNTVYAVAAMDQKDCKVYILQDIMESNESAVLETMQGLGFVTAE